MMTSNRKLKKLSDDIRRIIDGQAIDLRDNRESIFSMLKNDIHTLASLKNEQVDVLQADRDAMKDMLANISHQIKTPLTSMLLMLDLLENSLEADVPSSDKQAEFISNIRSGLTHTDWLISALLKMAKLDAGTVDFIWAEASSSEITHLALDPLQILLDDKNQSVSVIGDSVKLRCDRRWTAEALTNVLKNASEHSPAGGVITVAAGNNPICSWISVTDCGKGITDIPKLFRRFADSGNEKGHGIGLALSLAIMQGQNGDIEVDGGGNGSGATFTLKFFK